MKNNFIKDAVVLFVITLILGVCLSVVKTLTDIPIARANEQAKKAAFLEVNSKYDHHDELTYNDNNSQKENVEYLYKIYDVNNNDVGYIVCITTTGYGGEIKIIIGFDENKSITGIAYPESLSETPGLGMRITLDDFKNSFDNKNINNIDSVDTLSGATISSSAVKNAVSFATKILSTI